MVPTQTHTSDRRILVSYAHPDDEAFGLGGAIAYYADSGVDVHLICATDGDVGDVSPEFMQGYDSVGELRLAELACAAEKLGIKQVHTFGYRDSGMMGTPDNDHPDSLWHAPQDEIARRVTAIIRQVRPQVVVTFDAFGGYGHPDHIAIHRATVQAFHEAADPDKYPEQLRDGLTPYQPQKLYYGTFPRTLIRIAVAVARVMGQDPRHMGRNKDMDFQAVLDATLPTHTRLDLRAYYDRWMEAGACHASQQSPRGLLPLPHFVTRQMFGWQTFYRAWPEVNGQRKIERDLFAGVSVEQA